MGVPIEQLFAGQRSQGGTAYRRAPYFRTKKLGLLGSTDSLEFAPWHDPSWTLAAHPCCRPRCKREPDWYFDMHRPECFRAEMKQWNPAYHSWLKALQTPIFMQEHWPEIPMAVRYPRERIFGEFRQYFSNHCAYMIALAMTEGVTHIGLFGCQYAGAERTTQRDSLTYWLGRFEQAGGTVVIPDRHNTLLTMPLYGYASHDEHGKLLACYRPMMGTDKTPAQMPRDLDLACLTPLRALPPGQPVRTMEMAFA
jgi:hypothetical protein